jgi:hypothetical protein
VSLLDRRAAIASLRALHNTELTHDGSLRSNYCHREDSVAATDFLLRDRRAFGFGSEAGAD